MGSRVLEQEVLKNSGFSSNAAAKMVQWMDEVTLLVNDLKDQYTAHCADATAHNSADTTNAVTADDATDPAAL